MILDAITTHVDSTLARATVSTHIYIYMPTEYHIYGVAFVRSFDEVAGFHFFVLFCGGAEGPQA